MAGYGIIVDGVAYGLATGGCNDPYLNSMKYFESMALSSETEGDRLKLDLMPLGIKNRAVISSKDPDIKWVPYPYLFFVSDKKNIYEEIATGRIRKGTKSPSLLYRDREWNYIQEHYDQYVEIILEEIQKKLTKYALSSYTDTEVIFIESVVADFVSNERDNLLRQENSIIEKKLTDYVEVMLRTKSTKACFIDTDTESTILNMERVSECI
ncbi:MAG: hypothetical protein Q4C66_07100 [Lachnospiraceae bacterium]|nr:hypothetical protein [Lachnospiraceae bacterium]